MKVRPGVFEPPRVALKILTPRALLPVQDAPDTRYIYISHKVQNIKRRQVASESLDLPTILYLRGTDYELAVSQEDAGVSAGTMEDVNFNAAVLKVLQSSSTSSKPSARQI